MIVNDNTSFEPKFNYKVWRYLDLARFLEFCYANCWHINDFESAALWKLYSDSRNSLAIQSTVERLKQSLQNAPERLCLSEIQYADYDNTWTKMFEITKSPNSENQFNPATFKRISFKHERELRIMHRTLTDPTFLQHINEDPKTPIGEKVHCEINTLIETVYVSPTSEAWFKNLVTSLIKRFNLEVTIIQSGLYTHVSAQ